MIYGECHAKPKTEESLASQIKYAFEREFFKEYLKFPFDWQIIFSEVPQINKLSFQFMKIL